MSKEINTYDEVDSLPVGSVIADDSIPGQPPIVYVKVGDDKWECTGTEILTRTDQMFPDGGYYLWLM